MIFLKKVLHFVGFYLASQCFQNKININQSMLVKFYGHIFIGKSLINVLEVYLLVKS